MSSFFGIHITSALCEGCQDSEYYQRDPHPHGPDCDPGCPVCHGTTIFMEKPELLPLFPKVLPRCGAESSAANLPIEHVSLQRFFPDPREEIFEYGKIVDELAVQAELRALLNGPNAAAFAEFMASQREWVFEQGPGFEMKYLNRRIDEQLPGEDRPGS